MWFYYTVMIPEDGEGLPNSVDPDQTNSVDPDQTV